ncbi:MAG: aminopeptidase P family protein [Actinobacteria bacterium]|nr:aminopeptidase P family protein [Actinomycetota bacterium]
MYNLIEKKEIFAGRLKKLRRRLDEIGADGIIIIKDENIFYITGFYGHDSGSALVITKKEVFLIVHFIYFEKAKTSVLLHETNIMQFRSNKKEVFEKIFSEIEGESFGIESSFVNYESYIKYKKSLKKTAKKLINLPGFVEKQRIIKDSIELEAIKKACSIADEAIKNIIEMEPERIKDFTESRMALYIEELMLKEGASSRAFNLIVAGNASSSLPHYEPAHKILQNGILLFDIGCIWEHYCSDITRTIFIRNGPPGQKNMMCRRNIDKIKEIYDIVLGAQLLALQQCREGMTCSRLDAIARDFIEKKGYGQYFGHGLGHGVGLEVHEGPTISGKDNTVLEENMVITIEPGIYIGGIGGVRIEDMVIVKKGCAVNLYNCPKTEIYI